MWRDGVEQLFSRELIACIREGQKPRADQVAVLAEKLWKEAIAPGELGGPDLAEKMARVALAGGAAGEQVCHDSSL